MVIYFTPILVLTYFTTKHYYKQYQLKNHPYHNLRNIQTSEQLENLVDKILEHIKFYIQNKPTQIPRDSKALLNILGTKFSPEVSKTVYNALENNNILLHDESFSPTLLNAVNLAIEKPLQLNVYDYLFKVSIICVGTYDLFHMITPQPYYDQALERIETIKLSTKASLIALKDSLISSLSFIYKSTDNLFLPKISITEANSTIEKYRNTCIIKDNEDFQYLNYQQCQDSEKYEIEFQENLTPTQEFIYKSPFQDAFEFLIEASLNSSYTMPSLYTIIENMFFPTKNQTIHEAICDCVLTSITLSAIIDSPIIMPYPLTNWVLYQFHEGSKPNSSYVSTIVNYTILEQNADTCRINGHEDFQYLNYQQCKDSEKFEIKLTNTSIFPLDQQNETFSINSPLPTIPHDLNYVIYLGTIEDIMLKDFLSPAV